MSAANELALLRDVFADALARDRPAADALDVHAAGELPAAWGRAVELGWPLIALPEADGGAGEGAGALIALAEATGEHAVSTPVLETALVRWALWRDGREQPTEAAVLTLAEVAEPLVVQDGRVHGMVRRVPWARYAQRLLLVGSDPLLVELRQAEIATGANLAGEPRDDVVLHGAACEPLPAGGIAELAALVTAACTLGALRAARRCARNHARTRSQFGRPIARFQLVAAHLARTAAQVELSEIAIADAIRAHDDGRGVRERIAIAKGWTARAAGEVAERAHQVHGAIGVTREHDLHLATRRLWSWRDEWGSEADWAKRLGALTLGVGAQGMWELITA